MKQMWDKRFSEQEYVYGKAPNDYFKKQIDKLKPGKVLLPAEGEGRNAVYAASQGWEVHAFDQSVEGRKKALALADEKGVHIHYDIKDIKELDYDLNSFDVIALCYCHLPNELRADFHPKLPPLLNPNGSIILEGFSINNLTFSKDKPGKNGPRDPEMLFTTQLIETDFNALKIIESKEDIIELDEGENHQGKASVIRFFGKKM